MFSVAKDIATCYENNSTSLRSEKEFIMTARISAAVKPYSTQVQGKLDGLMPEGVAPLQLFTTLARDERLFERFMDGGLLDKGHLSLRQREIIIDRVTAKCGSEYEWGVHIAFFATKVDLSSEQIEALFRGNGHEPFWSRDESLLIAACDTLLKNCDLNDGMWALLTTEFPHEAILEIIMLVGFYRNVSCLTNSLRLPLEKFAARFPTRADQDC
jgi:alkylhydroperoxidase family enzyme